MATSRDIQEIISKLSSDKAKSRDEAIRLLNSWLEGERAIGFCKLLGKNTARIKPDEIPHAETWPFLLTLLTKCITLEISLSKKRPPKLLLAKTLRTFIQYAEDPKLSGKALLLFPVVKMLFNHIWDVIKDVPSFQSEYSSILRYLLAVKEYRYQMRKRVYCSLVILYVDKVHNGVKANTQSHSKEEVFRSILTLHVLLENPPGDFPADIREDLVKEFTGIFSHIRDEGKISRKLMECINTFLLKDGPNLGYQAMEIHCAVKEFLFRYWLTTHDRTLKSSFILYARLQLKLSRSTEEEGSLIEQLFDIIAKELDQNTVSCTGMLRDDKVGNLGSIHQGLLELAAAVFYQACKNTTKTSYQAKRMKIEPVVARVKDGIMRGSWFWNGAFSFLIHNYSSRIDKSLLVYWFEGICESLQRILNSSDTGHSSDALLWLLRALQELSLVLVLPTLKELPKNSPLNTSESLQVRNGWNVIWSSLMHILPIFSNATPVVDAALRLLGNMILRVQIDATVVPLDIWDLRIFKQMPSLSALYFMACYFSWKNVQGYHDDVLYLRRSLLRAVLELINFKEPNFLNEQTVILIPAAIFSLSVGCAPFLSYSGGISMFMQDSQDWISLLSREEANHGLLGEVLDCSVEFLAEIELESSVEVKTKHHNGIHLPRRIRQLLTHEIEEYITGLVTSNGEAGKIVLSDIFNICTLLCNCIHGSLLTRMREEKSLSFIKMFHYMSKLLELIVSVVEENSKEIQHRGWTGCSSVLDASGSTVSCLRSFISCPLFSLWKGKMGIDCELLGGVVCSLEKLLLALAKLFAVLSSTSQNLDSGIDTQALPLPSLISEPSSICEQNLLIIDVELDANASPIDVDTLAACGSKDSGVSISPLQWKLELVSAISTFFFVSPLLTWDILLDMMGKENDAEVSESILLYLCKFIPGSSGSFSALVSSINNMMLKSASPKLCCLNILTAFHSLLRNLRSTGYKRKHVNVPQGMGMVPEENFDTLGDLMNKVADIGLPDWFARIKLIDCICSFVLLEPRIAQAMIERLLAMLQDTDYRVRLFLARRVGVLFQTWDGHNELFHDICSNFGFDMLRASKGKLVKAGEVVVSGDWSFLAMETALITIVHLAFFSEDVETEAVFMICSVAAVDPAQRKLAYALLDTLSRKLEYASLTKYLDALIGSILARWVACDVSLVALLEVQELLSDKSEAKMFMQYCCPWILPHLILRGDMQNLNWVSEVSCRPLHALVKEYFVPIFAVCMAVHCRGKSEKENGSRALRDSILHIAKISELERDELIKKHMVSIVSCLLSLTSSSVEPALPFFSKDTVVLSVQTIVDGFLDMVDYPTNVGIVDKINMFRPDRVFKFLVELHYQIAAAIHPRHKCHRLSAIEVLVHSIGHRAAVSSTSNYIVNIVGQCIGNPSLQDQCCVILSKMLEAFKSYTTKEFTRVLGEQLQFLVSKLVACCIPSENQGETDGVCSSSIISLLHQLTVDADSSLHDYIRELEPFPELVCFERVRIFHEELCKVYSPRDQFLKFVRRTCHLPQGLLLWSLRTLHTKLLIGNIIKRETSRQINFWNYDPEVVTAVWTLVGLCSSDETNDMCGLLADFISRVGIGDPFRVVFQLPKDASQKNLPQSYCYGNRKEACFYNDNVVSEELLIKLLRILKKYLLDDSVKTVDMASLTLCVILSTERGQGALLSLDSYEKSLIAIHSKGVNLKLVEKYLLDPKKTSTAEAISLEDSSLWRTDDKTYELWICSLVHSLISHCDDIILRLCQDIVMLKAEVAELLFASVLMDLAGRIDSSLNLCQLISTKFLKSILTESHGLVKPVQVLLDALNRLRSFYFTEKAGSFSTTLKHGRPSSYARTRSTPEKNNGSSNILFSSSFWKKVYWLSIDYLVVAKAAIRCGSYFTAVMYVEHWCEEHFNGLMLGYPDFSHLDSLPPHIELLVAAFTQINEPDSIYGVIQSHKLTSQIITHEHEGNWSKAVESYDLLVRSEAWGHIDSLSGKSSVDDSHTFSGEEGKMANWKSYKGLMRSLQKTGCTHVLDVYCQGLTSQKGHLQHDLEFAELQYEAAWRSGNWDFSLHALEANSPDSGQYTRSGHFNENLHSCLRALQDGDDDDFHMKLTDSKKELLLYISDASKESTEYIYSTIVKLQILDHLGMAWDLRWKSYPHQRERSHHILDKTFPEPVIPTKVQLEWMNTDWSIILGQAQLHLNFLEPFIAFRRILLQILDQKECATDHLLKSASILRKGSRFSLAAAALHELKLLCCQMDKQKSSHTFFLGRLEEAKILWAQGQHEMAVSLAKYILQNYQMGEEASNVYRLVGKWLAETRSSNSRTILEQYLKHSVELTQFDKSTEKCISRQCQTYFHLAHYTDGLFKSYEERLASNEWQAAMRLRKHKTRELDALIRRLKNSTKGEKTDYSIKIQELQKQLTMDREEAEKLQDDRDNFLSLALEGYQRCLVIGGKYDLQVVFRLVSLWFSLYSRQSVVKAMHSTVKEVQSYKFIPLVYQIASRLGSSNDGQGSISFQKALVSLLRKMAIDHPYHTMFQLLALANGDRIKDKQRSRNSFVVDMDKKLSAENLLNELSSCHGAIIQQMKQMVDMYIKLAELETKKEETNKKIPLPREIRSVRQLQHVPVVTATIPVDPSCQYKEGSFPYFKGLADSITVMNGINAPKVVECFGSDGHTYRQLAKSGNDDLRQDAVMEQFFGLVNSFLQNHRDTWKRRIRIRTYKVVPFTPSAGVLEWVDRTIPLGDYLLGSTRNGGAHGRYGTGDWPFLQCREYMAREKDKREAFLKVCENFRPVMHYFFLERFLQPADWFESRLSYTRSVAASSMVGYIVGLGDRHSMNILIDQATAEVVHIDLGVAFEQGLMLKTPERVPFRLTRDIIDGMGATGVEGVFRRCCEETLSVMRTNKEALLTIIEVFIHDPLYKWALSPLKALQRQKETDDDTDSGLESSQDAYEGNKDAARATLRVKQKLDGYEEGEMRSVQGQVQQLIQDAIDTDRLCQMFPGWAAWL